MRGKAAVAALLMIGARHVCAQAAPPGVQRTNIPIPYRTYLAASPLFVPFDIGSLELESAAASGVTTGTALSYADIDHRRVTSLDAKLRFYPGEVVLRGFSVGLSAGWARFRRTVSDTASTVDAPAVGILADNNWLVGPNRRFVVGVGAALKRLIASPEERKRVDLDRVYVTGRFVVGYAF